MHKSSKVGRAYTSGFGATPIGITDYQPPGQPFQAFDVNQDDPQEMQNPGDTHGPPAALSTICIGLSYLVSSPGVRAYPRPPAYSVRM